MAGRGETLDGEAALQAAIARLAAGDIVAASAAFIWPAMPVTPLPGAKTPPGKTAGGTPTATGYPPPLRR